MKALLYVLLIAVGCANSGCTEPRHPGRDQCYLLADSVAARSYATQCIDYPDTRVCPHGDAIEEQHGKDLEACK